MRVIALVVALGLGCDGSATTTGDAAGDGPSGDLLAHWTFDEGSGTTTADASGHGNTMTLQGGVTWVGSLPGRGGALRFDGATGYGEVAASTSIERLNSAFTLSVCVEYHSHGQDAGGQLVGRQAVDDRDVWSIGVAPGDGQYRAGWGGLDDGSLVGGAVVTADRNRWVQLALTFDGATISLFRNGEPLASAAVATSPLPSAGLPLLVAAADHRPAVPAIDQFVDMTIDDLRLYGQAVEVASHGCGTP